MSLARTQPLSSPRRRGPITTKVSVIAGLATSPLLRRMGPRLRGDDSGESLLHIFASGNAENSAKELGPRIRAAKAGTSGINLSAEQGSGRERRLDCRPV